MDVLVAYGSKMGGTAEIAEAVGTRLTERGHAVILTDASSASDASAFDAVVIGSALYSGRWRTDCVKVIKRLEQASYQGPVWIFHSGPLGDEDADEPQPLPGTVGAAADSLDVRDVKTFPGRLVDKPSGIVARLMARSFAGDWRDWGAIDAWADGIASALDESQAA